MWVCVMAPNSFQFHVSEGVSSNSKDSENKTLFDGYPSTHEFERSKCCYLMRFKAHRVLGGEQ